MKTSELREKYLSFFESKGCVRRPSDVLVPRWDPSVLFTPAGMNQFKDHFLGKVKLDFTRATTCQKCLRTGDIDNVGRTAYHHTFFEMLGNFSFGDYFKREAINWAWEFLTDKQWLGLPKETLTVTVYKDDDEAYNIWNNEIGLDQSCISRLEEDENFWPASCPSEGPDGVCGPCSEIYYHTPIGEVEIWNLVFTQFNRKGNPPNNLFPLPSKNIDTGMGLERAASALQGVTTNYHIDILLPIVYASADVVGVKYNYDDPKDENGRRLRRITDHIRACTFAIHENVYPGPNKEEYVIKRLLRRASLDGHQMGVKEPFLYKIVPAVVEMMKDQYPELEETVERVQEVIKGEEANFLTTIDGGVNHIDKVFDQLESTNTKVIPGDEAAELYTTYGVPPEMFAAMGADKGYDFDWDGYKAAMEEHAKQSGAGNRKELFKSGPLDDLKKQLRQTPFVGYEKLEAPAIVMGILADGALVDELTDTTVLNVAVVLNSTPFYAEKGGQMPDTGTLTVGDMVFEVTNVQQDSGLVLHIGQLKSGTLTNGSQVMASVNAKRRAAVSRAHSATHLLHYALQKHLGPHAQQRGSKVDEDVLRFDFTQPKPITTEQIQAIEREVNQLVLDANFVESQEMPIAQAREAGATMLFGEKYPDIVRVVTMGGSKELCGGTHLYNTAMVGGFRVISEEAVSAGTRRIVAWTGEKAIDLSSMRIAAITKVCSLLRCAPEQIVNRIEAMQTELKKLKKQASVTAKADDGLILDTLIAKGEKIGDTLYIVQKLRNVPADALRDAIDGIRRKVNAPCAVMFAVINEDDKLLLMAGLNKDLVARGLDAVKWIRPVAALVKGGGGGRPDLAQAGGKDLSGLDNALAEAKNQLEAMLG